LRYSKKKKKEIKIKHCLKIKQSLNNIFITFCTIEGLVLFKLSKGLTELKFNKKRSIFLFELIMKVFLKKCLRKVKRIRRHPILVQAMVPLSSAYMLKGCLRAIKSRKIRIHYFYFFNKKGFNGLRKKKQRRK
tara:strand:- start:3866 stop:4264 length:399 start_codon:yes stop_codon:yes gene_type:complete